MSKPCSEKRAKLAKIARVPRLPRPCCLISRAIASAYELLRLQRLVLLLPEVLWLQLPVWTFLRGSIKCDHQPRGEEYSERRHCDPLRGEMHLFLNVQAALDELFAPIRH